MTYDLWAEATRDIESEQAAEHAALAQVRIAVLWPFISLATDEADLDNRIALATPKVEEMALGDTGMVQAMLASLRTQGSLLLEAKTVVAEKGSMMCANCGHASEDHANGKPCPSCGCEDFEADEAREGPGGKEGSLVEAASKCSNCANGNHTGSNGTGGCKGGSCTCKADGCGSVKQSSFEERLASMRTALEEGQDPLAWILEEGQGEGVAEKPSVSGNEASGNGSVMTNPAPDAMQQATGSRLPFSGSKVHFVDCETCGGSGEGDTPAEECKACYGTGTEGYEPDMREDEDGPWDARRERHNEMDAEIGKRTHAGLEDMQDAGAAPSYPEQSTPAKTIEPESGMAQQVDPTMIPSGDKDPDPATSKMSVLLHSIATDNPHLSNAQVVSLARKTASLYPALGLSGLDFGDRADVPDGPLTKKIKNWSPPDLPGHSKPEGQESPGGMKAEPMEGKVMDDAPKGIGTGPEPGAAGATIPGEIIGGGGGGGAAAAAGGLDAAELLPLLAL